MTFLGTFSWIPGLLYLRAMKTMMGYTGASATAAFLFRSIVDIAAAIPLNTSVEEFLEIVKKIEEGENPPKSEQLFPNCSKSYVDDVWNQTPSTGLEKYKLGPKSFFRPPKSKLDEAVYLHLNLLAKHFARFRQENLLLEINKFQ